MQGTSVMCLRGLVVSGILAVLGFLVLDGDDGLPEQSPSQASGELPAAGAATGEINRLRVDPDVERESAPNADARAVASVAGRVGDVTGAPLGGVSITAWSDDERPELRSQSVVSDARGHFALAFPAATAGELAFTRSGYRPNRTRVRAPCTGLEITLERSPALRGRVVLDGAPVPGALVRWSNPQLGREAGEVASTQADGRFSFANVPWTLDLDVLAPGSLPAHRFVEVTWGMQELVVALERGRVATGRVLDAANGAGIAGASVSLWYYQSTYTADGRRGGPAHHAETVTSSDDGSFSLSRLPKVEDPRRAPAWLWITAPGRAPLWKLVESPARNDGLSVSLFPAASVRGRVVRASGGAVAGHRVFAEAQVQSLCDAGSNRAFRQQDGGYSAMWNTRRPDAVAPFHTERDVFTDVDGSYRMDNLPCVEGGAAVTIALPEGAPRVTVVVRPREVAVAADLVVPAKSFRRCHGVVCDEHDRPVGGASVAVGVAETVTDVGGRFDFEVPLVPEEREIRASASGHVPFRGVATEDRDGAVKITLVRGGRLLVLVVDRDHRPVPNASVMAFAEGGLADFAAGGPRPPALRRGRTDDRGAVRLAGVPGSCDVLVEHFDAGGRASRKIVAAVPTSAGELRVALEDVDAAAAASALTVRVVNARTGAEVDGPILVEAASDKGNCRRLANGPEVRLDGLFPGEWRVCVAAEGLGTRRARVELPGDRRLEIRLGEGLEVAGQVIGTAGPLTQSVQVQAREVGSTDSTIVRTDAQGRFAIVGVDPGEYLLSVGPFESEAFASLPVRKQQGFVSTTPTSVRVTPGTQPMPVTLAVVPVVMLHVEVIPSAADRAAASIFSWSQGVRFRVADEQGSTVHDGGPSNVLTTAAELLLPVREGRYTVTVSRRGEVLGRQSQAGGETWRLQR